MEEKKIKNYPDYVPINGIQTILKQMMNCICKIKINKTFGTGFFCQFSYENIKMNALMTNYHVLDENCYNQNDALNLFINDEKELKIINFKIKRITYFNKLYDLTIIELKENDNINNYLELDDNLFKKEVNVFYKDISIYIPQYPLGNNAAVSYGLSTGINKFEINHLCSTENGSSGSPIINLSNFKVIGIHKKASKNFNYNIGTCLQFPLNDFFDNNKKEFEQIKMILPNKTIVPEKTGFPQKIGVPEKMIVPEKTIVPYKTIDNILNEYIKKSKEFYERLNKNINNMENKNECGKTMNILFMPKHYRKGFDKMSSFELVFEYGKTIDEILKIYLRRIGLIYFPNKDEDYPSFYTNESYLKFGDKTPIEIFFENDLNPIVSVDFSYFNENDFVSKFYNKLDINEVEDNLIKYYLEQIIEEKIHVSENVRKENEENNKKSIIYNNILCNYFKKTEKFYERLNNELISTINNKKELNGTEPKMNIIIIPTRGLAKNLVLDKEIPIDRMLKIYLNRAGKESLIGSKKILFLWNGSKVQFGDRTPIYKYFYNVINPKIVFIDASNGLNILSIYSMEDNLIKLYRNKLLEDINSLLGKQKLERLQKNITIEFINGRNVLKIKMPNDSMIAELLYEYSEKTKTNKENYYIYRRLYPFEYAPLYEIGLKDDSIIFVK